MLLLHMYLLTIQITSFQSSFQNLEEWIICKYFSNITPNSVQQKWYMENYC